MGCYRGSTMGLLVDDTPVGMFGWLLMLACCWMQPIHGEYGSCASGVDAELVPSRLSASSSLRLTLSASQCCVY